MGSILSPYQSDQVIQIDYVEDKESSLEREDRDNTLLPSGTIHTVMEGETLQNISFKYYADSGRWGDIASINGIIDPLDINPGDVLEIPL